MDSFFFLPFCIRQVVAGLMQAQQNACAVQTLSNKTRIMLSEIEKSVDQNKGDIINAVYTKSGCTLSVDGSRVCFFP
jgi:hypothetical protein